MLTLRKIAVTGGIATGKSTVCHLFHQLGAYVVSADAIVHELLDEPQNKAKIIELFGPEIVHDGKISKSLIATQVFQDPKRLDALEKVLHPLVFKRIEDRYLEACKVGTYRAFVVEIPLLFEVGAEKDYDVVIAVVADEKIAEKRFSKQEYAMRKQRQLPSQIKAKKAHYTIENNGTLQDLEQKVRALSEEILPHES